MSVHVAPKASILIVDDEPSLLEVCQEALSDAGFTVHVAHDGPSALRMLEFLPGLDLVISDLRMPGMSGLELLKKLKDGPSEADFLIMTGFGSIETAVESIRLGAADYLPKPFNISHLLLKVERILEIRLNREDRKKLTNLVRMLNLSQAMNTKLDLDSLTSEFVSQVQKNFDPDGVALYLHHDNELHSKALRGDLLHNSPRLGAWTKLLGERVFRRQSHELILLRQNELVRPKPDDHPPDASISSIMASAITTRMQSLGAIVMMRNSGKPDFSSDQFKLLKVFAAHSASAFENARLYGQLWDMNLQVIRSFAQAVEAKDVYTRGHSDRVALFASHLGNRLGLSDDELDLLYTGGILHDIGKIGIPDIILNKPSKLTTEEFSVMQRHPELGKAILNQVTSFSDILPIIYSHHERVDGTGYPNGLRQEEIPLLARILSVADSFEAMTSDRAYRRALPITVVRDVLRAGAGRQWQDDLVTIWLEEIEKPAFHKLQDVNVSGHVEYHDGRNA